MTSKRRWLRCKRRASFSPIRSFLLSFLCLFLLSFACLSSLSLSLQLPDLSNLRPSIQRKNLFLLPLSPFLFSLLSPILVILHSCLLLSFFFSLFVPLFRQKDFSASVSPPLLSAAYSSFHQLFPFFLPSSTSFPFSSSHLSFGTSHSLSKLYLKGNF